MLFKRYLSKKDFQSLSSTIGDAEKSTCGQIRVVVRHRRHRSEWKLTLHELALGEFYRLGMEKTHARTGVLILILFSERQFQIVADDGIHTRVEDGTWEKIAEEMSSHFRKGRFRDGIAEAIRTVGAVLAHHFPRESGDANELPDEIVER